MNLVRKVVAVLVALAGTVVPTAQAQESIPDFYREPGLQPNRDYVNQHVTENVDPFTGALQIHSTDVHIPGNGGFDLNVVRSYNSNRVNPLNPADANTATLAGLGWTVHFGRVIKPRNALVCANTDNGAQVADNPVLELPDGSRQVLAFTGLSPLMLTAQRWRADCLNGTGLAIYSPDGVRYDMTQQVLESGSPVAVYAWYTTLITDRNGNTASVQYAGAGSPEIVSVTTSDSRVVSFGYADAGLPSRRISTITADTRTWTYSYLPVPGVAGRFFLTRVTRPDVVGSAWRYDYNGLVGGDHAANYQMSRLTYPQGGSISYGYGHVFFDTARTPAGRSVVVASKSTSDFGNWTFAYSPGYSSTYDTTTVNTPGGVITYRHFGANLAGAGSVWRIGLLAEKVTGTEQSEMLEWGYQVISPEDNVRPGAFGNRIDPDYRAPVLTRRTITRNGATYTSVLYGHDAFGNPTTVEEVGPNGGARTTILSYYINTSAWIVRQVSEETTLGVGSVTRAWDARGNLQSETRDGVTTSYQRTSQGDVSQVTRPRGLISSYSGHYRGIAQNESHEEGVSIVRTVSAAGNVLSERNGEGHTTQYSYDGLSRLTRIVPPINRATDISYATNSRTAVRGKLTQVTTEDEFGRVTQVQLDSIVTTYGHDPLGRKTFQSLTGDPSRGRLFTYDALDRPLSVRHADGNTRNFTYGAATVSVRDERGYTTTYAHRAYGDPDRMHVMSVAAPLMATSMSIARNGRDKVTSVTQDGVTRQFGYDTRYYLTSATHPEIGVTRYGRDDAGNMTSKAVEASPATLYTYDRRNRLRTATYPNGNPSAVTNTYNRNDKLAAVANSVAARKFGYDANQNLISEDIQFAVGPVLSAYYAYNDNDHRTNTTYPVRGTFGNVNTDYLGRINSVGFGVSGTVQATATYWPNGQLRDVAYWGGSSASYGQNAREWTSSVTVRGPLGVSIANAINYDAVGNVASITDSVDPTYARTFSYDEVNRMRTANGPWGGGTMAYDGRGNITAYSAAGRARSYMYDSANRLSRLITWQGATFTNQAYAYDGDGNAIPAGSGYAYDAAGNLLTTGSGQLNTYDGTNTRIKYTQGNVTVYEFRSTSGQLLSEWRQQPGVSDRLDEHIYVAGKRLVSQRVQFSGSTVQSTTVTHWQTDAAGSTISSTGLSTPLKENYLPYGERRNGAAGNGKQWFAGQSEDASNLIYMGARFYDPVVGRFLSMDPKEVNPADLHSFNRYAYANNNPSRFVDPDGHSPLDVGFLVYDLAKLGHAVYTGGAVRDASVDVAMSVLGVLSPVPGTGQALKAVKVADKTVDTMRSVDKAIDFGSATRKTGTETIVIGEGMAERVIPTAKSRGANWYDPPKAPPEQWMGNNQKWINQKMDEGCRILDCGSAPGRANYPGATSPYYKMELEQIKSRNYPVERVKAIGE